MTKIPKLPPDRLEQAEQEIVALTLSVSIRDARIAELESGVPLRVAHAANVVQRELIAELEAQLEDVGVGGSMPLPDAETVEFLAAFEDCAGSYMRLDMKRKGDGYRSPTTMIAFEVAFGVVNRLRAAVTPAVGTNFVKDSFAASDSVVGGGAWTNHPAANSVVIDGNGQFFPLDYVAQPAPAVVEPVYQYRVAHCSDWYDGFPDTTDGKTYQTRTLYAAQPAPAVVEPSNEVVGATPEITWSWLLKNPMPVGSKLYTAPQPPASIRSDSDAAHTAIEAVFIERNYPCNPGACARAGFEAASRLYTAPQPHQIAEPASELHSAIMLLPLGKVYKKMNATQWTAYMIGHRDARHAAAELVATPKESYE